MSRAGSSPPRFLIDPSSGAPMWATTPPPSPRLLGAGPASGGDVLYLPHISPARLPASPPASCAGSDPPLYLEDPSLLGPVGGSGRGGSVSPPPAAQATFNPSPCVSPQRPGWSPQRRPLEPEPQLWERPPQTGISAALRTKDRTRKSVQRAAALVLPVANAYNEGTNRVSKAQADRNYLRRRAEFVASLLPPQFLARVADGRLPGSSAQVSAADRQETLVCTLEEAGGRDGKSLCSHKTTLADLIDFGAAAAVPVDVCRERLGPAFVATFLESQYQRGLQEKSANLASSALASLRFLAEHCGLDAPDLHCKQVTTAEPGLRCSGTQLPPPATQLGSCRPG